MFGFRDCSTKAAIGLESASVHFTTPDATSFEGHTCEVRWEIKAPGEKECNCLIMTDGSRTIRRAIAASSPCGASCRLAARLVMGRVSQKHTPMLRRSNAQPTKRNIHTANPGMSPERTCRFQQLFHDTGSSQQSPAKHAYPVQSKIHLCKAQQNNHAKIQGRKKSKENRKRKSESNTWELGLFFCMLLLLLRRRLQQTDVLLFGMPRAFLIGK